MPVPTKKNGVNQPKLTASILRRNASPSSPRVASPTTIPAAKPPRTPSNPNSSETTTNVASTSNARRTGNCVLARIVRLRKARNLGGRAPMPTAAARTTSARKASRYPNSCQEVYPPPRPNTTPAQRQRRPRIVEVDFHARHEQHDDHADGDHRREESVDFDQSQPLGPDEDSEQDLQDDDWHSPPSWCFGQQRRRDRHGENDERWVIAERQYVPPMAPDGGGPPFPLLPRFQCLDDDRPRPGGRAHLPASERPL